MLRTQEISDDSYLRVSRMIIRQFRGCCIFDIPPENVVDYTSNFRFPLRILQQWKLKLMVISTY